MNDFLTILWQTGAIPFVAMITFLILIIFMVNIFYHVITFVNQHRHLPISKTIEDNVTAKGAIIVDQIDDQLDKVKNSPITNEIAEDLNAVKDSSSAIDDK
ncbi:hypothetical protein ACYATM_00220 [Lactobacillaceae bacterium Scapto_B20]